MPCKSQQAQKPYRIKIIFPTSTRAAYSQTLTFLSCFCSTASSLITLPSAFHPFSPPSGVFSSESYGCHHPVLDHFRNLLPLFLRKRFYRNIFPVDVYVIDDLQFLLHRTTSLYAMRRWLSLVPFLTAPFPCFILKLQDPARSE